MIHAARFCRRFSCFNPRSLATCIALFLTLAGGALHAQENPDLAVLTVDELMDVEVTSVSRKGQKLADTAAAVFVITQDDIRRSGATSIPEILRIVPGLDVARINGNVWAISARGFNGQFANKLLVMIDGRTVYTPLFSGVYWDVQDTLLEDVDRIEVIRGPGGTLWGANAVNGIINIITKHAIDTKGTLLSAGGGATEGPFAAGRFGGAIGKHGFYRIYGKSFDRPSTDDDRPTNDASKIERAGFRADWTSRRGDNFTFQGDVYAGSEETISVLLDPENPVANKGASTRVAGHDLQFSWTSIQSERSDTTVSAFYDSSSRRDPSISLARQTFDLDFQHHLKLAPRHDAVWGAEYRVSHNDPIGPGFRLVRDSNVASLASAFIQDEIRITPRLHVTAGTKLQYDDQTRLQLQPTLRLRFQPTEHQTLWAAATSSAHTPAETQLYGRLTIGTFPSGTGKAGLIVVIGNPDLAPERVDSYELGYRVQANPQITFDATLFHNEMRRLFGSVVNAPYVNPQGTTVVPIFITNAGYGQSQGAEFLLTDTVTSNWNIALGYSFLQLTARNLQGPFGAPVEAATTPHHQVQLRSSMQLPRGFALDSSAFYVGRIGNAIDAYVRLDAQLSWKPKGRWALSISGQNLLQNNHVEFIGTSYEPQLATPVERSVNGKVTWRF